MGKALKRGSYKIDNKIDFVLREKLGRMEYFVEL